MYIISNGGVWDTVLGVVFGVLLWWDVYHSVSVWDIWWCVVVLWCCVANAPLLSRLY